ncbi:MAG: AraC family transcriptional regulator [Proteobacteria bacterium]|nr:AraC family transcriptional regulator [Pseudomonadota bacterium]
MRLVEEQVLYEHTRVRTLYAPKGTFDFHWHCHEEYEISLILEGRGTRFTADQIAPFNPPEMIFVPARLPHTWQSSGGINHAVVVAQFRRDFTGADVRESPDLAAIHRLMASGTAWKIAVSSSFIDDMLALHEATGVKRLSLLLRLLDGIERAPKSEAGSAVFAMPVGSVDRRMAKVLDMIQKHWGEPLLIPDLAAAVGMSESSFRRYFRKSTGRSAVDYILQMKVARACELLADSSLGISNISELSGFGNLAYFNRKFKELKRMTPSEYRWRHNCSA